MLALFLGWVAAVLAATVALPQVVRLIRARTSAGISLTAWRLTFAANLAWSMHGVHTGHLNVTLPNLVFASLSFTILFQLRRDRGLGWLATFLPSAVLALTAFGSDLALGPVAFAVAAGVPSILAQLMQFRELVVAPRIGGVSLPFLGLNVVNQILWFTWSLQVGELSVTPVLLGHRVDDGGQPDLGDPAPVPVRPGAARTDVGLTDRG